ncbi:MAG: hypothetical protein EXS05_15060 [Planctomycetaceae bacterium]|nr:hypothetical protein [Planctomycetaceae bacterium]
MPTAGFWIVVALVVLPVLYVASIGPAYRMAEVMTGDPAFDAGSLWGNSSLLDALYAPLEWASDTSPLADSAIMWYVKIWL